MAIINGRGRVGVRKISAVPSIVTSGLKLHLDAGNVASYTGTGTAWADISSNGNNGVLTNGPTYNSANGGIIVFDGVNDYLNCEPSAYLTGLIDITASIWVKPLILPGTTYQYYPLITRYAGSNGWDIGYSRNKNFFFGGREIAADSNWLGATTTSTYEVNTWNNVVGAKSGNNWKIYVNGVLQNSFTGGTGTIPFDAKKLRIGAASFDLVFSKISVSNAMIYNRALSDAEVLQNYNALRGRFGL